MYFPKLLNQFTRLSTQTIYDAFSNWSQSWNGRKISKATTLTTEILDPPSSLTSIPTKSISSEAPVKVFSSNDSSYEKHFNRWMLLNNECRSAFFDRSKLEEYLLDLASRQDTNIYDEIVKLNKYIRIYVLYEQEEILEWLPILKDIWKNIDQFINKNEYSKIYVYSQIRKLITELNQLSTDRDSLQLILMGRVYGAKPKTNNEAREKYLFYLNGIKNRQSGYNFLFPDVICLDSSAADKLKPIIPDFNIVETGPAFKRKVPLKDFFHSQNISGVPAGLDDVVITVAAAYDDQYKTIVSDLGLQPERGMIFYGPPGTGKTVMAKAIAEYFGCPDKQVKITAGSNLLDKWVGNTEKGIRELFMDARENPNHLHIIIIDEIEAILSKRSNAQQSWETSRVTQFLTELDGINSPKNIFVIGITNHLDVLDPAAIRPGRLGTIIEVPLPDEDGRESIFNLYLQKIKRDFLSEEYTTLAKNLAAQTPGFSGAEIKACIQRTCNVAFMKVIRQRHFQEKESNQSIEAKITLDDFLATIKQIQDQRQAAQPKV